MTEGARSRVRDTASLLAWLVVTFAVSAIGARASISAASFYAELTQPAWAPPGWVFGPVWTTLYALMAIAAWLVWREGGLRQRWPAFVCFFLQLGLNALWSWLFFAWHLGGPAFAEVLVLWAAILATIILFWRARPTAGILMIPYLLWVSFAAVLNFELWRSNPALLG